MEHSHIHEGIKTRYCRNAWTSVAPWLGCCDARLPSSGSAQAFAQQIRCWASINYLLVVNDATDLHLRKLNRILYHQRIAPLSTQIRFVPRLASNFGSMHLHRTKLVEFGTPTPPHQNPTFHSHPSLTRLRPSIEINRARTEQEHRTSRGMATDPKTASKETTTTLTTSAASNNEDVNEDGGWYKLVATFQASPDAMLVTDF